MRIGRQLLLVATATVGRIPAAPAVCSHAFSIQRNLVRLQLILDYAVYLAVRVLVCLAQALSLETCATVSRVLAVLAADVLKLRQHVVEENMRHAFPHMTARRRRRLARAMWEHLLLMMFEIAQSPRRIHRSNWEEHILMPRREVLLPYLLEERPVVLLTGHFGNFELAGYLAGLFGFPTYTVARPLDNPYLHRFVTRWRSSTGQHMLPKVGSAPAVEAVLEQGEAVALLGDQNAGPKGCWVEFLRRPASCHKAIALFTLTRDVPMVVVYARRIGGPLQLEMAPLETLDPADCDPAMLGVKPITEWYSRQLEQLVLQDPEQYWWVHRRWKKPPPKVARRFKQAA